MAKIVYITKYPPLEGGMAAKAFWLARALGERGHEVHIITDAIPGESPYHIRGQHTVEEHPKVTVHRALESVPWKIPPENHSDLSLLDKTLEVIQTVQAEVICAAYLVPYGLVGCIASSRLKVPLVLQHGGSDINKFLMPGVWKSLWANYLGQACAIVTDVDHVSSFSSLSLPTSTLPPYVPDPLAFSIKNRKNSKRPRLALIGKANYYWEHKGWHRVIDIWSCLGSQQEYMVMCQGLGIDNIRSYVNNNSPIEVEWRDFVHPLEMPNILRDVDYLFYFERDFPYLMFSNLPLETLRCGARIVNDTQDLLQRYSLHGLDVSEWENYVVIVPPHETSKAAEVILQDISMTRPQLAVNGTDFDHYLDGIERVLTCKTTRISYK